MIPSNYLIVSEPSPALLSDQVMRFLRRGSGWELYGQPFVGTNDRDLNGSSTVVFCQTLIKSGAYGVPNVVEVPSVSDSNRVGRRPDVQLPAVSLAGF